jgi:hypothetical protein
VKQIKMAWYFTDMIKGGNKKQNKSWRDIRNKQTTFPGNNFKLI